MSIPDASAPLRDALRFYAGRYRAAALAERDPKERAYLLDRVDAAEALARSEDVGEPSVLRRGERSLLERALREYGNDVFRRASAERDPDARARLEDLVGSLDALFVRLTPHLSHGPRSAYRNSRP